jgi:hypothetical protein
MEQHTLRLTTEKLVPRMFDQGKDAVKQAELLDGSRSELQSEMLEAMGMLTRILLAAFPLTNHQKLEI